MPKELLINHLSSEAKELIGISDSQKTVNELWLKFKIYQLQWEISTLKAIAKENQVEL